MLILWIHVVVKFSLQANGRQNRDVKKFPGPSIRGEITLARKGVLGETNPTNTLSLSSLPQNWAQGSPVHSREQTFLGKALTMDVVQQNALVPGP